MDLRINTTALNDLLKLLFDQPNSLKDMLNIEV